MAPAIKPLPLCLVHLHDEHLLPLLSVTPRIRLGNQPARFEDPEGHPGKIGQATDPRSQMRVRSARRTEDFPLDRC
jgi:hypothetical protein